MEFAELKAWKVVQENKLALAEKLLDESLKQVEVLGKVLEDRESEIKDIKDSLCQAKKDAIREYRDFGVLLKELGISFVDGFDDYLHQVKALFPDLDLSLITIEAEGQTPARPVDSESTDQLFGDDSNPDSQLDEETLQADQEKSVGDCTH